MALLVLAMTAEARAAVTLDLSYVDKRSAEYRRFKSFVDRAVAGDPAYGFSATDAAYMYRLTGERPYGELAVRMVEDQVTAAEAATGQGLAPPVADDSYMYIGPMLRDLSLAYDWCGDLVTPKQKTRWKAYADQALANVWHPLVARWGGHWLPGNGWAIEDPGNNYFYSFTEATMYWALASDSPGWKTFLQQDRLPLLTKYLTTLPGGGSREGTSYGASFRTLFGLYRVWRDAAGTDLANANPHLTDTIAYWVHATVPTMDQFAPIGDQPRVSVPELYDYERVLMLEARTLTHDAAAARLASWWLHHISIKEMSNSFNSRHDLLPAGEDGTAPSALVYHASGVGQLFARTDWTKAAMWLNFTAGPYDQSHAHQSQGAVTLFAGDWLAVTENIWSRSGIQQGTATNNVVRFERGGEVIPQDTPTTSSMKIVETGANGEVHAVADLTPAYGGNPAIRAWKRSIAFKDRVLTIQDDFATRSDTAAIFQLNVPVQPKIKGNTATAGKLRVTVLSPVGASLTAVDWTKVDKDYTRGWRLDVRGPGSQFVVKLEAD
ncbi:hypothetical protein SAMN05428989_1421 [Pseudoxanthomonas sp. GM95]|uniref:hypothetical protein n=1 Tax=Pseudoxanthomonas sp. GM95 TaxID=1881043 RepID=UPI0008BA7033|nr:hypothetical protein [Pseudoxanthomonas sp. GM95]SEL09622.1 hypothetical protein SAMN05428989_1421 [Pseudoxanthomonas sp. GM95]